MAIFDDELAAQGRPPPALRAATMTSLHQTVRRCLAPRFRSGMLLGVLLLLGVAAADVPPTGGGPVIQLGAGDEVSFTVDEQPEMTSRLYVADDGTLNVALVGPVAVAGLSPSEAARRIETALRQGQYLVNPHVSLTVVEGRSQRVSVLGQVARPGRFPVEANTSILDLIAAAGGTGQDAADIVYVIRKDELGQAARIPVDLKGLADPSRPLPGVRIVGGDSLLVPRAPEFYVVGEVQAPAKYRLERGMQVAQAIARGGGVTQRGSSSRIEIQRRRPDGALQKIRAHPTDPVLPDDIVRVKERIF